MHEPCERLLEAREEYADLQRERDELQKLLAEQRACAEKWRQCYVTADRKYWEVKARMTEREPNGCKDCSVVNELNGDILRLQSEVERLTKQADSWAAEANLLKVRLQDSQNALKEVMEILKGAVG